MHRIFLLIFFLLFSTSVNAASVEETAEPVVVEMGYITEPNKLHIIAFEFKMRYNFTFNSSIDEPPSVSSWFLAFPNDNKIRMSAGSVKFAKYNYEIFIKMGVYSGDLQVEQYSFSSISFDYEILIQPDYVDLNPNNLTDGSTILSGTYWQPLIFDEVEPNNDDEFLYIVIYGSLIMSGLLYIWYRYATWKTNKEHDEIMAKLTSPSSKKPKRKIGVKGYKRRKPGGSKDARNYSRRAEETEPNRTAEKPAEKPKKAMDSRICPACGNLEKPLDADFCSQCGIKIN